MLCAGLFPGFHVLLLVLSRGHYQATLPQMFDMQVLTVICEQELFPAEGEFSAPSSVYFIRVMRKLTLPLTME